jgi:hypothetical protein
VLLLSSLCRMVGGQFTGGPRQELYVHMVLSDLSRKAFGKLSVQVNYSPMETIRCHKSSSMPQEVH